jgi:hypothetical protein
VNSTEQSRARANSEIGGSRESGLIEDYLEIFEPIEENLLYMMFSINDVRHELNRPDLKENLMTEAHRTRFSAIIDKWNDLYLQCQSLSDKSCRFVSHLQSAKLRTKLHTLSPHYRCLTGGFQVENYKSAKAELECLIQECQGRLTEVSTLVYGLLNCGLAASESLEGLDRSREVGIHECEKHY